MYSESDINAKAWLVREIVDLVLQKDGLKVDKIFLIGSYAAGKSNDWSDIDYLVQLDKPMRYPDWYQIQEIHGQMNSERIHIIFGSKEAQESLKTPFKEIQLPGRRDDAVTHSSIA